MNQDFFAYYRCPTSLATFVPAEALSEQADSGYFLFGPKICCFGRSTAGVREQVSDSLPDVSKEIYWDGSTCVLPFDPTEVALNLRHERYVPAPKPSRWKRSVRRIYYALRPLLTVSVRRHLQRASLKNWKKVSFPSWPVDCTVDQMFTQLMRLAVEASPDGKVPFIWFWPEAKASCAIMTHDVETAQGLQFVSTLMDWNDSVGIKSSFQVIPDARYFVRPEMLSMMKQRQFEVNVHDLKHDGHLFDNHRHFIAAAERINQFAASFDSKGFRSAVLYREQEWLPALNVSYDMSVPNVGHLDPQTGGCCTVMPYFLGDLLELPVTMTQDYTLFHILQTYSQDLWHEQIRQVMQQHGLISFIVHPDYLQSTKAKNAYMLLLHHLSALRAEANLWIALPGEVDTWWRQRSEMTLVPDGAAWRIEGKGAERARIAYATIESGELTYVFS